MVDPLKPMYDVTTEDGKYRFVYLEGGGCRAYRHGERWHPMEAAMLGNKALMSLVVRVAELEAKDPAETSPEVASMAARILASGNPLDNDQVISAVVEAIAEANSFEGVRSTLRTMFQPYFENALSLARFCLPRK